MMYFIIICLSFYVVFSKHEEYDGHSLYQINIKNLKQINLINDLENELYLDVWLYARPGRPGQVLVPKKAKLLFENKLNDNGIEFKVDVQNIRDWIELEDQQLAAVAAKSVTNASRLSFDRIHTYDAINAYIANLAKKYRHVTLITGGISCLGRPINYLKISTTKFQDSRKPVIMVQSLIHAREWITQPVTIYAINKLVVNVTDIDLLRNFDWIIVPVVNPDGYVWSHTKARFWRKNRRTGKDCVGVDINRNFNSNWGTASSNYSCSEIYHGAKPLSEPESRTIAKIIKRYKNRIALFLDIHSFGSIILYGYGNGALPRNALTLNLAGVRMAQAINKVKWAKNPNYIVGNTARVLYPASGTASDHAQTQGVPLCYAYEMPAYKHTSGDVKGFLVNDRFIKQAGYETWEGIKAGARFALKYFKTHVASAHPQIIV